MAVVADVSLSLTRGWLFLSCLCFALHSFAIQVQENDAAAGGEFAVTGLWSFDGDLQDRTGSWSEFGRAANGSIDYDNPKVGKGAYSAVHGEESLRNWRHHATGRIRLTNHAELKNPSQFGIALWVRPEKLWSSEGRIISFGPDAFGIAPVAGREGVFRLVNTGLAEDAALPELELPLGQWRHVAVTADGENVSVLVDGAVVGQTKQTGSLKAGEQLYIGALGSGGRGLLSTAIDELVIVQGPVGVDWARWVYARTAEGVPLEWEPSEVAAFEPVDRDMSGFFQVVPDRVELEGTGPWTVKLEAYETPMLGAYVPSGKMATVSEVLSVIEDLKAHHCNTVALSLRWALERPSLLRLFHDHNFYVFVMVSLPYGEDYVREHPEAAQQDHEGNRLRTASFYDEGYIVHLYETFLAEGLNGRGMDGLILDEPSHRDYRIALREGRLYHHHPAEQEVFFQMFGVPFPDTDLNNPHSAEDLSRIVEFRRRMIHEWFGHLENIIAEQAGELDYHVVLTPDNVSQNRRRGYLSGAEATGIDVDELLSSELLDGIQFTAYLNAWGKDDVSWVAGFLDQFQKRAHQAGKASIFWAQAYMESPRQVQRGIPPGQIAELVDLTLGAGVDGVMLWSYRGFSQKPYGWEDFFDEFGNAAAKYVNRPATGIRFQLEPESSSIDWQVRGLGDGLYELNITRAEPGEYVLIVRNRAGFESTVRLLIGRGK